MTKTRILWRHMSKINEDQLFQAFSRQYSSYQNHHLGLWSSHHEWDSQLKGCFLFKSLGSIHVMGWNPFMGVYIYIIPMFLNMFSQHVRNVNPMNPHMFTINSYKSHVFPSTNPSISHHPGTSEASHPHAPRCWWHFEIGIPRAAIRFHHSTLHLNEANLKRMHNAAVVTIDMNK